MSDEKKVRIMLDPDVLVTCAGTAFKTVLESPEQKVAVVISLGTIEDVEFILTAYHRENFDPNTEELYMMPDDPGIYQQLNLDYLH